MIIVLFFCRRASTETMTGTRVAMTALPQLKTVIANIEKKTGEINEIAVTTQLANEKESSCGPQNKNAHRTTPLLQELDSSGRTSLGRITLETAVSTTCQAGDVSVYKTVSAEQFDSGVDYGYEADPPKQTKKGMPHRRSSCGTGIVCTRIPRRSSISGLRRRNSLGVCLVMTPDSIDEDNDCFGFTVTNARDIICEFAVDDDDRSSAESLASFSRRGSAVSRNSASQGGDDEDRSVISKPSQRVRELPRDVEFDSDGSSSSSESDSEEMPSKARSTLRW